MYICVQLSLLHNPKIKPIVANHLQYTAHVVYLISI